MQSVVGPAWLVAGPGLRDILAVAAQKAPVAVPSVAVRVVGASIPPVVPVIVVAAVAAAVAASSIPVVVLPTRPEVMVQSAGGQRTTQSKKL